MTKRQIFFITVGWWFTNALVLTIVAWGGAYCIEELGMRWMDGPREFTLITFSVVKLCLSMGIVFMATEGWYEKEQ